MKLSKYWCAGVLAAATLSLSMLPSCQKFDDPPMDFIDSDTASLSGPLVGMWAFEGDALDSVTSTRGTATSVTYVDGVKGLAYKGATNAQIRVMPAGRLAELKSFTISQWINTTKHTGGAQAIWMLTSPTGAWGNMSLSVEGTSIPENTMQLKFYFAGQWLDFGGANRIPDMYERWVHVVFTYDAGTSKVKLYIDGSQYTLPAGWEDRVSGGNPLGEPDFSTASGFVIGAFQSHLGSPWNTPDSWMLRYTGLLDQLRIYDYPMTADEIQHLYTTKL